MIKKIKSFFTLPFYPNPCPPRIQPQIFHSRTGQEVDIALEDRKGWLVGIEVKRTAVVGSEDFKGLQVLGEAGGKHFHRGKEFPVFNCSENYKIFLVGKKV